MGRLNPRTIQRHARRLCLALAAAGAVYLLWRFDLEALPEEGCSPLLGIAPGARFLLDRAPPAWAPGDAALFRGPDGVLYLGRVAELRPAGAPAEARLATDCPDCEGKDSDELGWISVDDLVARVVMVWPW